MAFILLLGCCLHTCIVCTPWPGHLVSGVPCHCAHSSSCWRMQQGGACTGLRAGPDSPSAGHVQQCPPRYLEAGRCTGEHCALRIPWLVLLRSGQKREEISWCCPGEAEDTTRIQGEEEVEEGYPSDIRFRSQSPVNASGTGGSPTWQPQGGVESTAEHYGRSHCSMRAVHRGWGLCRIRRRACLTRRRVTVTASADCEVRARRTRDGQVREK